MVYVETVHVPRFNSRILRNDDFPPVGAHGHPVSATDPVQDKTAVNAKNNDGVASVGSDTTVSWAARPVSVILSATVAALTALSKTS